MPALKATQVKARVAKKKLALLIKASKSSLKVEGRRLLPSLAPRSAIKMHVLIKLMYLSFVFIVSEMSHGDLRSFQLMCITAN